MRGKKENPFANTFEKISQEVGQEHELRQPILRKIQELRDGRTIVSFFVTFRGTSPLSQHDADQLEEVLCNSNVDKGITLLLDAPGGDGLAAERIIQVCRSYADGNEFETIVAARAKSAATMICLGSDRILMSPTSELGPIDPQVPMDLQGQGFVEWVAAHHITKTYDSLFAEAKNLPAGHHIEPFLQQLQKFNAVYVSELRQASKLSEDIAISSLKRGMLKGKTDDEIRELIKPFTDPEITMSHGRGINDYQAEEAQLTIEKVGLETELWKAIWALYMRSKFVVNRTSAEKLIDTIETSYFA